MRFWTKVAKSDDPNACWLWTGGTDGWGYGMLTGVKGRVTRLSWKLHRGAIPDGLQVCHNCPTGDNPLCVNPNHLWLGTFKENMQDKLTKGRQARGERAGGARLTSAGVAQIKAAIEAGERTLVLAQRFGVHEQTIWKVWSGETWRHTPWPNGFDPRGKPRRMPRGEAVRHAKLTESSIREIRRLHAAGGITTTQLAARFGVSFSAMASALSRQTWAHVTD